MVSLFYGYQHISKKNGAGAGPAPPVTKNYCKPFAFQYALILSLSDFGNGT